MRYYRYNPKTHKNSIKMKGIVIHLFILLIFILPQEMEKRS